MALDPGLVGRSYPPLEPYVVGREKIREFADAIGDRSPLSHDPAAARAAGYPDVVAPPTFAFVLAFRAIAQAVGDPDVAIDYSRVVHGEQRFTYARPIVAGDILVTTASIDAVRSAAGNDMLTTRADLATVDGEHVVSAFSVIVARGAEAEESA